jgi:hypothetical protein
VQAVAASYEGYLIQLTIDKGSYSVLRSAAPVATRTIH